MTETVVQDMILTAAMEATGLQPGEIGKKSLEYDALKREGLLVYLEITGQSMFMTGVDWGELGVQLDSTRAARMTRGRKYLYPKESVNKLNSVISAMRQAHIKYGRDLSGFRPARYVHYKVYDQWKAEWAELLDRFNDVKSELIADRDNAVDRLAADAGAIAHEAWQANLAGGEEFLVFGGHAYVGEDEFTDALVSKALEKMPDTDRIEQELLADYRVSVLYGLENLAKQEADAAKARELTQIETETAKAQQQEAYLKTATAQEAYNHEQRMIRLDEQAKELQIEAMMHAEAEHARDQIRQIASPFQEVLLGLRDQIGQDAAEILESVNRNGFIRGKVAEKGRGLLELFDLMSIRDDSELRAHLVQLKAALGEAGTGKAAPKRSTEEVVKTLESIQQLAHIASQDMIAGPSRFAMIDTE